MCSLPADAATPVSVFSAALEAIGGQVSRVAGGEDAAAAIAEAAVEQQTARVLYVPSAVGSELGIEEHLARMGIEAVSPAAAGNELSDIPVAITGAEMAIAESGTLLVGGTPGPWGLATVLPWVHVAVVRAGDVIADLQSAFELFAARLRAGDSNWVWITGPSRTADIGKTLVLGAHGPNSLKVLIVGPETR